jgi:transcriptional regulator of acetoin/glycerol metabolism
VKAAAHDQRGLDPEPDILQVVIHRVRELLPAITDEQAQQVETEARADLGGLRARVPKRKKHLSNEQRQSIAREAIAATSTDQEITERHGIGRATLYRYVKMGSGR